MARINTLADNAYQTADKITDALETAGLPSIANTASTPSAAR